MNTDQDKAEIKVPLPAHLTIPVDTAYVRAAHLVNPGDSVYSQISIDISPGKSYLSLDQITILNVLASSNWRRPVCFTAPGVSDIGLLPYLRREGLVYRVVPAKNDNVAQMNVTPGTMDVLLHKFRSGGADHAGVYYDEENRRHLLSIRETFSSAAAALADQGRKQEALAMLDRSDALLDTAALPFAMVSRGNDHDRYSMLYLQVAYKLGDSARIKRLDADLRKDLTEQKAYYEYMKNNREEFYAPLSEDERICDAFLRTLDEWKNPPKPPVFPTENPNQPRNKDSADKTARKPDTPKRSDSLKKPEKQKK